MIGFDLSMRHFEWLFVIVPLVFDESDDPTLAFNGVIEDLSLLVVMDTVRAYHMIT